MFKKNNTLQAYISTATNSSQVEKSAAAVSSY
jgi:hypothetical protein